MELKETYNKIAEGWSSLRQNPHPKEILKISGWKGKVLDAGCGNGVNLQLFKDSELYGIDFSESMVEEAVKFCKDHNIKADLRVGDILKLPYENKFFDYIILSKVLSHIKPAEQLSALKEIKRVLKGKLFIAAWNHEYSENKSKPKETIEPWTHKGVKYERYYYLFEEEEVINLLKKAGFEVLEVLSQKDSQNICIIAGMSERPNVLG